MKYLYIFIIGIIVFLSLMTPINGTYHKLNLFFCFILLFLFFILKKDKKLITLSKKKPLFFLSLYVFFSCVAAIINNDQVIFKNSLQLLFIYLSLSLFLSQTLKEQTLEVIIKGTFFGYLPFLYMCLVNGKYTYNAYMGIYNNPNIMGASMVSISTVICLLLMKYALEYLNGKNGALFMMKMTTTFIGYIFICYVIMISNARTSLFIIILEIVLLGLFVIARIKKTYINILKYSVMLTLFISIALFLITNIQFMNEAYQEVINKMEAKSSDITSGRTFIWLYVIENTKFWGNGSGFLESISVVNAHNLFLDILSEGGIFPFFTYILFLLSVTNSIRFKFLMNNLNFNNVFIMLNLTSFVVLNTFESLHFNIITYSLFMAIGLSFSKSSKNNVFK